MMFGRVDAIAVPVGESISEGPIRVTVYLETGRTIRTVREVESCRRDRFLRTPSCLACGPICSGDDWKPTWD